MQEPIIHQDDLRSVHLAVKYGLNRICEVVEYAPHWGKFYLDAYDNQNNKNGYYQQSLPHDTIHCYDVSRLKYLVESIAFIDTLGGYKAVKDAMDLAFKASDNVVDTVIVLFNDGNWKYRANQLRKPLMLTTAFYGALEANKAKLNNNY